MDFFKRLFGRRKSITSVETIIRGEGFENLHHTLSELFEAQRKVTRKKRIRTPLFLTVQHPEVNQRFRDFENFHKFINAEVDAAERRYKEAVDGANAKMNEYQKMMWDAVELYMQANGLWPAGEEHTAKLNFEEDDGVLYHLQDVEK